jgi:hypothetical protein
MLEGIIAPTSGSIRYLTHLIAACRAIMIDGADRANVSTEIAVLLAMTVVFLLIGSFSFRWQ